MFASSFWQGTTTETVPKSCGWVARLTCGVSLPLPGFVPRRLSTVENRLAIGARSRINPIACPTEERKGGTTSYGSASTFEKPVFRASPVKCFGLTFLRKVKIALAVREDLRTLRHQASGFDEFGTKKRNVPPGLSHAPAACSIAVPTSSIWISVPTM